VLRENIYKEDVELVIDDCITVLSSAVSTLTTLITNTLFFLIRDRSIVEKVREEIKDIKNNNSIDSGYLTYDDL
jgi:hypothetical protein